MTAAVDGDDGHAALRTAASRVLRRTWRRVLRDARGFGDAGADERHRTRKRLKRFRYGLEYLMPLLARKPALRLHRAVCRALDALGELNDLHTAERRLRDCAAADPRAWFAVGWVAGRLPVAQAAAAAALQRLARRDRGAAPWRRLRRAGPGGAK